MTCLFKSGIQTHLWFDPFVLKFFPLASLRIEREQLAEQEVDEEQLIEWCVIFVLFDMGV